MQLLQSSETLLLGLSIFPAAINAAVTTFLSFDTIDHNIIIYGESYTITYYIHHIIMSITTRLSRRRSSRIANNIATATTAILAILTIIITTIPTITNAQDSDSNSDTSNKNSYGMDRGDYSNIFQQSNTVIMNNSNCRYTTSIQTMTCMGVRCQNSHSGGCSNEELLVESSQNNCSDNGEDEQPIVCEYDVLCCPISSMMEEDNEDGDTIDGMIGSNWVGIGNNNNNNNNNDGWSDSPQMYTGQVEYTPSIRTSSGDSGGNGIGAGIGFAFVFGIGLAIFIAITRIKQRSGDQIGHVNIGGGAALALQSGDGTKRQKKKKKQPNNSSNSRSIYDIDDDSEDYSELSTGSRRSSTLSSKEGSGGNSRSSRSSRSRNSNNYHHHNNNKRVPRDPSLDPFEIGGAGE